MTTCELIDILQQLSADNPWWPVKVIVKDDSGYDAHLHIIDAKSTCNELILHIEE